MSQKSMAGAVEARCPKGCKPFQADVWSLINASSDPELKELVMSGELNLLICPACGTSFYQEVPVVYADPELELLAFLFPHSFEKNREALTAKMMEDYKLLEPGLADKTEFG